MTETVIGVPALGGKSLAGWCGGWAQKPGRRYVEVDSAADLSVGAIPDAAQELDDLICTTLTMTRDQVVGFGHSQGSQIIGHWLREYGGVDPRRLRFVLTGNPERAYFGYAANKPKWIPDGNLGGITPNTTSYEVLDIGRKGDLWANYPGGLLPMLLLPFNVAHTNYDSVDPDNLTPLASRSVGLTTYVTVS